MSFDGILRCGGPSSLHHSRSCNRYVQPPISGGRSCKNKNCTYNVHMAYQWDPRKAGVNRRKHGVHFADAVAVFADDRALTQADDDPDEDRLITIGLDGFGRIL